jgi:fructoselysine-6-P-deglycase FrlB-like protein
MVERHFPVILFAAPGAMMPGVKNLADRLKELRAETVAITSDEELASICSRVVPMLPEISEFLAPIPISFPVSFLPLCWRKPKDSIRIRRARSPR